MGSTRRHILGLAGSGLLCRILGAEAFDVDRLLSGDNADCRAQFKRYTAGATVTLFSIPLVSRACVGSGYAVIEQADGEAGRTLSLQFGAGSYPDSARGLNRLGFIQEAVVEERPGIPLECAWLAFMTTSRESNLDQAKKALESSGAVVPYSASQGRGRRGQFACRVERLEFPARYTWRDIAQLAEKARAAMAMGPGEEQQRASAPGERPATFLYMVHQAMAGTASRTTGCLVFNAKQFQLDAQKEKDEAATTHFQERRLIPLAGFVMRMDAMLTERRTGEKTPFRLWYEAGAAQAPPLRFEYQARPFLRLTFEADDAAGGPTIRFDLKAAKENS